MTFFEGREEGPSSWGAQPAALGLAPMADAKARSPFGTAPTRISVKQSEGMATDE